VELARATLGLPLWHRGLAQYSGYAEGELAPSFDAMLAMMQPGGGSGRDRDLAAVSRKYSSAAFGEVAKTYPLPAARCPP
jgi:hypothetical protein